MSNLKPCPFCGGCDISREYGAMDEPYMICMDCGCSLDGNHNKWNRRDDLPPTTEQIMADPRVKALVDALEETLDDNNWRLGQKFDPNSGNFDLSTQQNAYAKIKGEQP